MNITYTHQLAQEFPQLAYAEIEYIRDACMSNSLAYEVCCFMRESGWINAAAAVAHVRKAREFNANIVSDVTQDQLTQAVETNAQGGQQHKINFAMHRLDPKAMLALGQVLELGDKLYNNKDCAIGEENWRKISGLDHLNHALTHIIQHMHELQYGVVSTEPDAGEHLSHAMCRLMFALGSDSNTGPTNSELRTELQQTTAELQALRARVANLAQQ